MGAGTRSRQGCASPGRRREGHSLDSFHPTCCPGPFQGGDGGCAGRAAAGGERRVAGVLEPRRLPRPPCSSSSAASWGHRAAGPRETATVVSLAWVLVVPRLAVHQPRGALRVSPQAPLLSSLPPPRLRCPRASLSRSAPASRPAPPGTQGWLPLPAPRVPLRHPSHPRSRRLVPGARLRPAARFRPVWRPLSPVPFLLTRALARLQV